MFYLLGMEPYYFDFFQILLFSVSENLKITGHSQCLSKTCRLCALTCGVAEDKYNVNKFWFLEFLSKRYENVPDFEAENWSIFPKYICKTCYRNFHHFNTAAEKQSQSRKAKSLRSVFEKSPPHITLLREDYCRTPDFPFLPSPAIDLKTRRGRPRW